MLRFIKRIKNLKIRSRDVEDAIQHLYSSTQGVGELLFDYLLEATLIDRFNFEKVFRGLFPYNPDYAKISDSLGFMTKEHMICDYLANNYKTEEMKIAYALISILINSPLKVRIESFITPNAIREMRVMLKYFKNELIPQMTIRAIPTFIIVNTKLSRTNQFTRWANQLYLQRLTQTSVKTYVLNFATNQLIEFSSFRIININGR